MPIKVLPLVVFSVAILLSGCADRIRGALTGLCDPEKIATSNAENGVHQRVWKIVYWLEQARLNGRDPETEMREVMVEIGWGATVKGELTAGAMVRNRVMAEQFGCLDEAGMDGLRFGKAPIIRTGPHAGDELCVAQMIPVSICPELDTTLANLELVPLRMNRGKSPPIERQFDLAVKFYDAGFLSDESLLSIYRASAAVLISEMRMAEGPCGLPKMLLQDCLEKQTVELKKRGF